MAYKKKLIEVALPLPEINDASAYDKMPGIGPHPKGIHHWWARLPLPTARAVLFASVVDDPSEHPERFPTEAAQSAERERLFDIVRKMMGKKLHEHPGVYAEARAEMMKHCDGKLPTVFDPFAGGGSIPLEANRLGFETHAADLNPVAVLLNKCNLEIVPRWSGNSPINAESRKKIGGDDAWPSARGLAEDVRYYARLIRGRAIERIGHLYPKVTLPREHGGGKANVIAWIWTRTVTSEDAAAQGRHVPLVSTYWLSTKKDSPVWLHPVVDRQAGTYRFEVRTDSPRDRVTVTAGTKAKKGGFYCLLTGTPIMFKHVRNEGAAGRLGRKLVAVVAEGRRGRVYLPAMAEHEQIAESAQPTGYPDTELPEQALGFRIQAYGICKHWQMFTPRQLCALVTISDLIKALHEDICRDGIAAGLSRDDADAYAAAVMVFLALALDRGADFNNSLCGWSSSNQKVMHLFGRQAIPMVWDFAEANILAESVGGWDTCSEYVAECIGTIGAQARQPGQARQVDAATGANGLQNLLVSTDPPYYDNIGYAALSDCFYIWLRRTISSNYRDLFATLLVPKTAELTAAPELHDGDKEKAKAHFEAGFRSAFAALRDKMDPRFPLTVYYAFKQEDEQVGELAGDEDELNSKVDLTTGWETLLEALIGSRFQITGTWPVRASQAWRMRAMGSNALASYIVLACRPRVTNAPQSGRREFIAELRRELPPGLRHLQQGNVAPVDFAQAAIGPGMAVYSRYSRILESNGQPMSVRAALGLINQVKDEVLGEAEADYDPYTRWAVAWYDQHGFAAGEFGDANTLANAHAVAVSGLKDAGLVHSGEGEVRLLRPEELETDWEPGEDARATIWEMTNHLVHRYFVDKVGDAETAALLGKFGGAGESARDLAYRLHSIAERRKRSQDAQGYNALVLGWPELARLAQTAPSTPTQAQLI